VKLAREMDSSRPKFGVASWTITIGSKPWYALIVMGIRPQPARDAAERVFSNWPVSSKLPSDFRNKVGFES
jgi:hypothetical protein